MKKIISNINHHLDDYECMWNGIEDLYVNCTNERIPDQFFFSMSGFCGFVYIKTNKSYLKRMVSFGEGRTKQMYSYMSPIVGFDYKFIENKTPELALIKAKEEIDKNNPIVIGAFDMYYLEYYSKLYHKEHIPFHYFLMIGYDDELRKIYLFDCGRKEKQELSYEDFLLGMNAEYKGLCKPNTICKIRMNNPKSKLEIVKKCLFDKANNYINPKTGFIGINGIKKLVKELPNWEKEIGKEETKKVIKNMIEFMGSVPQMPNKLLGINSPDNILFMCSRDKFSRTLNTLGNDYNNTCFNEASKLFMNSGKLFAKLCDIFVDYILHDTIDYNDVSKIILNIGNTEYEAYQIVLDGLKLLQ